MTRVAEAPYTLKRIEQMLGLGRATVMALVEAGFVQPQRGARNEYRFSFQDVVLLRTAHQLRAAHIPQRRLLQSLKRLKAGLPEEVPLSGLRITAVGNEVAVREADAAWRAGSGQLLFDFEVAPAAGQAGTVSFLERRSEPESAPPAQSPDALFSRAEALEAHDPAAAENLYRQVLARQPGHLRTLLNLGVLLGEAGRHDEAVQHHVQALDRLPDEPLLHFNHALALEDAGRPFDALKAYAACLALAPDFADAHFNAARLHEELGEMKGALRHYSAYRRLQPGG